MIISINGHDGVGKTTLINNLVKNNDSYKIAPKLTELNDDIPSDLSIFISWIQNESLEVIIGSHLLAFDKLSRYSKSNEVYLLDRGWFTLRASSIARVIFRKKCSYNEGVFLFNSINNKINYNIDPSLVCGLDLLLEIPEEDAKALKIVEHREGGFEDDYRDYIKIFINVLNNEKEKSNLIRINALDSEGDTQLFSENAINSNLYC